MDDREVGNFSPNSSAGFKKVGLEKAALFILH